MARKSTKKGVLTTGDIEALAKNFITKKDTKNLVTKEDIKNLATKSDLSIYVTKDYLDIRLDRQKDEIIEEFKKFRSDFYDKIDPILKEVKASQEERLILSDHSQNQSDRIEVLEKIHPQGRHLPTA